MRLDFYLFVSREVINIPLNIMVNFSFSLESTLPVIITVPLEIGFGQSSAHVQDLENLQLHQQPLQLPRQPPPLLEK